MPDGLAEAGGCRADTGQPGGDVVADGGPAPHAHCLERPQGDQREAGSHGRRAKGARHGGPGGTFHALAQHTDLLVRVSAGGG
jgi:hypothetical protein